MRFAVALLTIVAIGCGGSPTSPEQGSAQPTPAAPFMSAHFAFFPTPLDSGNIGAIAESLEAEYSRVTQDLGVSSMQRVNVRFYADHSALAAALAPIIGPIPSFASGAATSAADIHLISPNHPAFAPLSRMISNLVHEFAHCVSLQVNPRIANNPRWLWESVAIYESDQRVDPRTLAYMTRGTPPSFATLNSFDNTAVYEVGYTIAEFIVSRGGRSALTALVENNADVMRTLGMAPATFEQEWFAFVRARYGF